MRILDEQRDQGVSRSTILLTRAEAGELRDSIEAILKGDEGNHAHIPSEDFQKEITVALYDETNISTFNERCQRLIKEDS
jgi:hypothetical protein